MSPPIQPVEEIEGVDAARFERESIPAYRPAVIRGLAADWPLVAAARDGAEQAIDYIADFDSGKPADVMIAPPSERGRFFYRADRSGFNFVRRPGTVSQVGRRLLDDRAATDPPGLYAGATETAQHLPGFDLANPLPLAMGRPGTASRLWLSGRATIAPHYDLSDNIAVVALGRRRFTLFPPEATEHLYVGPLENTPAGQPVSMVDIDAPDLALYPNYPKAEALALTAELAPGDAIYVPSFWWHGVAALDPVNILVNYWFDAAGDERPFAAFLLALSEIRDLPAPQREAWRRWFDHFVFTDDPAATTAHLPDHFKGVQGPPSPGRAEMIRAYVRRAFGID